MILKKLLTASLSSLLLVSVAYSNYSYAHEHDSHKTKQTVKKEVSYWKLNSEKTKFHFTVVSNDSGEFKGYFNNGITGSINLDNEKSKGSFSIDLAKITTFNKAGKGNPVRDNNLIEAFFGVKDSSIAKDAVNKIWDKLNGSLDKGVSSAKFEINNVDGLKLTSKKEATCNVNGKIILWGRVSIPVVFPVNAIINNNELEIKGIDPVKFNLLDILGKNVRDGVFETLLAAGCPHKNGIQNDITVYLDKIVFNKEK